jgi:DNA-directed RNA polymerase specialized sigma24 family protein
MSALTDIPSAAMDYPSVAYPCGAAISANGSAGTVLEEQGVDYRFQDTRWSLVSKVSDGGEVGETALAELCRLAWFPLFAFARRLGWSPEDAEDAVQSFLAKACTNGLFASAQPDRGKLRTYLLTAFKRLLLNEQRRQQAQSRGGGVAHLPLNLAGVEEQYHREYRETETPDRLYHRQWAIGVLESALVAVELEYRDTGRAVLFEVLGTGLEGEGPPGGYGACGRRLGISENAARQAMHRLRVAFRRELWRGVALSLGNTDPAEIARDLEALREALAPD